MNMSEYKMIYEDKVYNPIDIMPTVNFIEGNGLRNISFIDVFYINEDGNLANIRDEANKFKFVKR